VEGVSEGVCRGFAGAGVLHTTTCSARRERISRAMTRLSRDGSSCPREVNALNTSRRRSRTVEEERKGSTILRDSVMKCLFCSTSPCRWPRSTAACFMEATSPALRPARSPRDSCSSSSHVLSSFITFCWKSVVSSASLFIILAYWVLAWASKVDPARVKSRWNLSTTRTCSGERDRAVS